VSREDIVAVVTRLFAIVLLLFSLKFLATTVGFYFDTDQFTGLAPILAMVVTMIAIAALLWYFPLTIARKLLPVMKEPRPASVVDGPTLFSLALMILGVWFLANAGIDPGYWGGPFFHLGGPVPREFGPPGRAKGPAFATGGDVPRGLSVGVWGWSWRGSCPLGQGCA